MIIAKISIWRRLRQRQNVSVGEIGRRCKRACTGKQEETGDVIRSAQKTAAANMSRSSVKTRYLLSATHFLAFLHSLYTDLSVFWSVVPAQDLVLTLFLAWI